MPFLKENFPLLNRAYILGEKSHKSRIFNKYFISFSPPNKADMQIHPKPISFNVQ